MVLHRPLDRLRKAGRRPSPTAAKPSKQPGCRSRDPCFGREALAALHRKQRFSRDTAWTISEEKVDVIRRMYEGFARSGPTGMLEFMDPEVDHRAIEGAPDDIGV